MSRTIQGEAEKVGITLPNCVMKQRDKARGDILRSTFIRKAIEALSGHTEALSNLGIPLTTSVSAGFALGMARGH